jgi:hypothetical protein
MLLLTTDENAIDMKNEIKKEKYRKALDKAVSAFKRLDPQPAADRAAVRFSSKGPETGVFHVSFFGAQYLIHWPAGQVLRADDRAEADVATRILLLHYLLTAEGVPLASQWIAFRNLPGGMGYEPAFQQRASLRLAHAFGQRPQIFETAARELGGEPLDFGDMSFLFRILPRIWMAVVLYAADEEFPANANVLFDAAARHYLPTEDLAILGGMLAGRLCKAA